jgi:hypothetical protein
MNDAATPGGVLVQRPVTPESLKGVFESLESGGDFGELVRGVPFRTAGLDSLDLFNLVLAIETATGLEIPDEDLGELRDLPTLATYLDRRLS